ncbi:MAG: multidrug transporter [bacterium]|nr:MAG: multidrug transporter [bacterium]
MNADARSRKSKSLLKGFVILAGLAAVFVALVTFLPLFGESKGISLSIGKDKIGLVEIFGPIMSSAKAVGQIKKYADDRSIKGILVHIDSPGGAVAPSQEIYNCLLEARKKKKVVASMGTLAASGGYYIAVGADRIVANPGTITGSIGVIMGFMDMRGLMSKLGIETIVVKSGQYKDIGYGARPFTDADRKVMQEVINDVYLQFVETVAKERNMEIKAVKKIADGRIFSGRQSMKLGMIDQLGGYRDALDLLSELAGIDGEPVIVKEKEKFSLFKELLDSKLGWLWEKTPLASPGLYYLWPSY